MIEKLKSVFRNSSLLVILFSLLVMREILSRASIVIPSSVPGLEQQSNSIEKAVANIVKPDDEIFLASKIFLPESAFEQSGTKVYRFAPADTKEFESLFVGWLDNQCQPEVLKVEHNTYFIWRDEDENTVTWLAEPVRKLNFFASFESVIPYKGDNSVATDKFLRLRIRKNIIAKYCEAREIAKGKSALVILDVREFPPFIGAVHTGTITWLASNEIRSYRRTDFEVGNMPASLQFILLDTQFTNNWTFTNQETRAYTNAIEEILSQKGLFFADKTGSYGQVASHFFEECHPIQLETPSLRQICLKIDNP